MLKIPKQQTQTDGRERKSLSLGSVSAIEGFDPNKFTKH